jgi:hypothetical protein
MSTHLIGPPEDNMQDYWNSWYSQVTLDKDPASFFRTELIFYPEGTTLYYHSLSYSNIALISLIRKALFLPISPGVLVSLQNLLILLSFYIAGIGCYFLAYHYVRDRTAAVLAGYIFAFSPYHWAHALHHFGLSSLQYIPFFVLCFVKYVESNEKKYLVGSVLFLVLSALSYWYYLVYLLLFLLFYYAFNVVRAKKLVDARLLGQTAKVSLSALLLLMPLLVPMLREGIVHAQNRYNDHNLQVADAAGFFLFHPYHLLDRVTADLTSAFTGNDWEKSVYLGIVNVIVLTCWFFYNRKEEKQSPSGVALLFPAMIFFMLLACGEYLHIFGYITAIPLPTYLMKHMPFLANVRTPSRAVVMVYLFLAIIVGLGIKTFSSRMQVPGKRWFVAGVSLLIFIDFYPNEFPVTPVQQPRAYSIISRDTGRFAILDLPKTYVGGNYYMMYQTFHGLPIMHASISRKNTESLADHLAYYEPSLLKQQLKAANVRYIVVHTNLLSHHDEFWIELYRSVFQTVYIDQQCIVLAVT